MVFKTDGFQDRILQPVAFEHSHQAFRVSRALSVFVFELGSFRVLGKSRTRYIPTRIALHGGALHAG